MLFDVGQQLLHHQLVAVNDVGGAQSQHVAVLFPGFLFRLFGSRFCVLGPVHLFEQQREHAALLALLFGTATEQVYPYADGHDPRQQQDVEQLGPPRLPKRRVDVERKCPLVVGPGAILVGAAHQQPVTTVRQVAERYAMLRAQIVPFVVNALQLVGISYHVVVLIVECSKLDGKVALPGRHVEHVVCRRVYRFLRTVEVDALEH